MISEVLAGSQPKQIEISDVQNEIKESEACTLVAVNKQNNQELRLRVTVPKFFSRLMKPIRWHH